MRMDEVIGSEAPGPAPGGAQHTEIGSSSSHPGSLPAALASHVTSSPGTEDPRLPSPGQGALAPLAGTSAAEEQKACKMPAFTLHEETPEPRPLSRKSTAAQPSTYAPHKPLKTHKSVLSQSRESVSLGHA